MNLDCNSWQLLEIYEQMRDRQSTIAFPRNYESGHDLGPLIDRYDAFFFDAFGVLNIGDSAIPGTAERIAELRAAAGHADDRLPAGPTEARIWGRRAVMPVRPPTPPP